MGSRNTEVDRKRIETLATLRLHEVRDDPVLQSVVRMLARELEAHDGLINIITHDAQWSLAFLERACPLPRALAFSNQTIESDDLLLVTDAAADPRFRDHPLVRNFPRLRFYAGLPINLNGCRVGALCVVGLEPRDVSPRQLATLSDLASVVNEWLAMRQRFLDMADQAAYADEDSQTERMNLEGSTPPISSPWNSG